jgi:hypothetical protein
MAVESEYLDAHVDVIQPIVDRLLSELEENINNNDCCDDNDK